MKSTGLPVFIFLALFFAACGGSPTQKSPAPSVAVAAVPPAPAPPPPPSPPPPPVGQTMQCPDGQYDMLDWATLDPDLSADHHMAGNANPLYTFVEKDRFYWMKGEKGYPWDIQPVDDKNIYLWVSEDVWSQPNSFKKSLNDKNMPLTPRCTSGGEPGTSVKSTDTSFEIVKKCVTKKKSNLGKMINEVWGPRQMSFGGDIPDHTDTLVVTYRYDCDKNYDQCNDREEFYLTQRYGLVEWDHSKWKKGAYVQDNMTVYNRLVPGGPSSPVFPCQ